MLGRKLLLVGAAWACAATAPAQFRDPLFNPPGTVNTEGANSGGLTSPGSPIPAYFFASSSPLAFIHSVSRSGHVATDVSPPVHFGSRPRPTPCWPFS